MLRCRLIDANPCLTVRLPLAVVLEILVYNRIPCQGGIPRNACAGSDGTCRTETFSRPPLIAWVRRILSLMGGWFKALRPIATISAGRDSQRWRLLTHCRVFKHEGEGQSVAAVSALIYVGRITVRQHERSRVPDPFDGCKRCCRRLSRNTDTTRKVTRRGCLVEPCNGYCGIA